MTKGHHRARRCVTQEIDLEIVFFLLGSSSSRFISVNKEVHLRKKGAIKMHGKEALET